MDRQGAALELRQNDELRIILVGKTGVGKSAAGNTILGRDAFISKPSPSSVTSECEKARGEVDGQWVAVIDTPGVFDTNCTKRGAILEISKCISLSAPGPHVFLIVIQLNRFTSEEKETVEIIQTTFGEQAANYTMVLFTHGEQLEATSIENYVKQSQDLQRFIEKCGGYHVFNNKGQNPSQVPELLEKINKMVRRNGGSHYITDMFQEAERAIREEEERILKKNEDNRRREARALEDKLAGNVPDKAIKELDEKYKRKARIEAEKKHFLMVARVVAVTAGLAGAGVIKVSERCSIQ